MTDRPSSRFDLVIVGAGPAGLGAALAAGAGTSSIAVLDQSAAQGGQIWRRDVSSGYPGDVQRLVDVAFRRATFVGESTVVDASSTGGLHRLVIEQRGRPAVIETATLILGTGARELFLPFPGWTLPGVLGVGGLQAMMKAGFDVRGRRIVIGGSGPLLVAVAAAAARKGAEVVTVAEQASLASMAQFGLRVAARPSVALEALRYMQELGGGVFRIGSWVTSARGASKVEGVTISDGANEAHVECDILATGYGLVPNVELARLLGCEAGERGIVVDDMQRTTTPGIFAAGECTGIGGMKQALTEGIIAGSAAIGLDSMPSAQRRRNRERQWGEVLDSVFAPRPEILALARPDTVVCRCEDVRRRDLDSAWTPRQAKLYTRAGMGACQGRVCGAALQHMFGWPMDTTRAPLQPAALSTLLGVL